MSLPVLFLVLFAALLHASWNLLVKAGRDIRSRAGSVYIGAGVIAACVLPLVPLPARASWPYLACATVVEFAYGLVLAAAYQAGDLSVAYPLMRGSAPLLVALGSAAFIGEALSHHVWVGIACVTAGILSLMLEVRSRAHGRAVGLALLNALIIAVYTTIDGLGVRASGAPVSYSLWLNLLVALPWIAWTAIRAGREGVAQLWRHPLPGLAGGGSAMVSYTLALWAMTRAPVASVAALRETAVLFGALLGAIVLKERVGWARALAALAIAIGVWRIREG